MNIGATLLLQEPFAKAFGKKKKIGQDVSVLRSVWYLQSPVALCRHKTTNRLGGVQKYGQK